MKSLSLFSIVAVNCLALTCVAQEPASTGMVLLLKTGHSMEGDVEKVGSQYRIRNGKSEVWISADAVLRLCAGWDDAFDFAISTINVDDADDRLKLARWCHRNGQKQRALEQARAALQIRPSSAEAKQMLTLLERSRAALGAPTPPEAAPSPEVAPSLDVSFDTLVSFTTKVQPILMNACANCHAGNTGSRFHLERVRDGAFSAATQRNLAVVLTQIDAERPMLSPLVVKAVTRHGDAAASPIRDRFAKPAQTIQQWIDQTIAQNPRLKDSASPRQTPIKKSVEPKTEPVAKIPNTEVVSKQTPRLEIDESNPPKAQPDVTRSRPMPADEFDPIIFNSWAHPNLFRQQPPSSR